MKPLRWAYPGTSVIKGGEGGCGRGMCLGVGVLVAVVGAAAAAAAAAVVVVVVVGIRCLFFLGGGKGRFSRGGGRGLCLVEWGLE